MTNLETLCKNAHDTRIQVGMLDTEIKNRVLNRAAECLLEHEADILAENQMDVENGK